MKSNGFLVTFAWVAGVCLVFAILLEVFIGGPTKPDKPEYTRTHVSEAEFDASYNAFRDSGMSEKEAGEAARAAANYLDKRRVVRDAERNRQR